MAPAEEIPALPGEKDGHHDRHRFEQGCRSHQSDLGGLLGTFRSLLPARLLLRRPSDRETLERIVTRVLVENRELFIAPCDQLEELKCLKALADRLLALEVATSPGAGTPSARLEGGAEHLDETRDRTLARSSR